MATNSPTATMTTPMTAAALLKLRGVPNVWQLCIGDHQTYVEQMRQFSPFDAEPVAIAPRTRPEPSAIAQEAIQQTAGPCQNGWFYASADVAFGIFQAILPTAVDLPSFPPPATPTAVEDVTMLAASAEDVTTAVASQGDVDPQLWDHVEAFLRGAMPQKPWKSAHPLSPDLAKPARLNCYPRPEPQLPKTPKATTTASCELMAPL